ncbi:MAG: general secretion pathway protein GspK [Candidatus Omnitrophica bacterium]|nr:general secretion pathway protein GspK [Candidatus Omnitrophota bacterium]
MSRQRPYGSVLIFVVWGIALLSVMAASVGGRVESVLALTHRFEQAVQADYIARAGVRHAAALLGEDETPTVDGFNEIWSNNLLRLGNQPVGGGSFTVSRPPDVDDGSGRRVYGFIDEERKLNVNTAPPEALARLAQIVARVKPAEAAALGDAIADWRDTDQERRHYGAEDFDYLGEPGAYDCKDAPFETPSELLLVKGMTPAVFAALQPHLTVYGSGRLNLNTASGTMLAALGLSAKAVSAIEAYRSGEDGLSGTADDRLVAAVSSAMTEWGARIPEEDLNRLMHWEHQNLFTVAGEAFRIVVEGRTEAVESRVRIEVLVNRKGEVLAWQQM